MIEEHIDPELEAYIASKKGFEYISESPYKSIKYKKDSVLIVPYLKQKYTYTILGFMKYTTGYLRYVGVLKNGKKEVVKITSRDIKEVDKDYKLSLLTVLKEL